MADESLYDPNYVEADGRFGPVEGVKVLDKFENRQECCRKGVHRQVQAGISGSSKDGAYSICVSGGYEDDEDFGDKIIYTGTGGQRESWGHGSQVKDQDFEHPDNAALFRSQETGMVVRVVRGRSKSPYSPEKGLRYDGLYIVTNAYREKGKSGFLICRYELQRKPGQPDIPKRWK